MSIQMPNKAGPLIYIFTILITEVGINHLEGNSHRQGKEGDIKERNAVINTHVQVDIKLAQQFETQISSITSEHKHIRHIFTNPTSLYFGLYISNQLPTWSGQPPTYQSPFINLNHSYWEYQITTPPPKPTQFVSICTLTNPTNFAPVAPLAPSSLHLISFPTILQSAMSNEVMNFLTPPSDPTHRLMQPPTKLSRWTDQDISPNL